MSEQTKIYTVVRVELASGRSHYTMVTEGEPIGVLHESLAILASFLADLDRNQEREELQVNVVPPHAFGYQKRLTGAYRLHPLTTDELELFWAKFKGK